jgi:hypothetical protein
MTPELLVILSLFILPVIPTFWAILDIPRRRFPSRRGKVVWFILVATFPFVGAMFYIIFGRRRTEPMEI